MLAATLVRFWLGAALTLLLPGAVWAQDPLLRELEAQAADTLRPELVQATFKGTRVINGHTIETPGAGTLVFLISHRFGTLNSGAYNFFGLDQATIRLGLEYGLTNRLTLGLGRSSNAKTVDGFVKYRALRQQTGVGGSPLSVTLLASSAVNTLRHSAAAAGFERTLARRLAYTWQALVARKISPGLSVQLSPTLVHYNLVEANADPNSVYALGVAGRQKLSKRTALTVEYYYRLPASRSGNWHNALGAGLDIETGGHVFQLHVTNANGMIESQFMPRTSGNFFRGDIYFGFNVTRNFTLRPAPEFRP